jgi:hypothetical protein
VLIRGLLDHKHNDSRRVEGERLNRSSGRRWRRRRSLQKQLKRSDQSPAALAGAAVKIPLRGDGARVLFGRRRVDRAPKVARVAVQGAHLDIEGIGTWKSDEPGRRCERGRFELVNEEARLESSIWLADSDF